MSTLSTRVLSLLLLAAAPLPVLAQEGLPTTQPAFLRIVREEVKLGRGAEHAKLEAGWPAAFERAKSPDYYLAMDSLTGSEAWFVQPAAWILSIFSLIAAASVTGVGSTTVVALSSWITTETASAGVIALTTRCAAFAALRSGAPAIEPEWSITSERFSARRAGAAPSSGPKVNNRSIASAAPAATTERLGV